MSFGRPSNLGLSPCGPHEADEPNASDGRPIRTARRGGLRSSNRRSSANPQNAGITQGQGEVHQRSSTRSRDTTATSNDEDFIFALGMDPGTATYTESMRLIKPGLRPRISEVSPIYWKNRDVKAPMIATFHDGFQFGHSLQAKLDNGEIEPEHVIKLAKVLLYDQYLETDEAKTVKQLLKDAGKTEEDLWTELLGGIWNEGVDYIWKSGFWEAFNKYPKHLYIAVPEHLPFRSKALLSKAAKLAGLPKVRFVSEPYCAGAYNLEKLWDKKDALAAGITDGEIIILDIGGGTGHSTPFAMKQNQAEGSDGARSRFTLAGPADGALCGSERIGRVMLRWLREECLQIKAKDSFEGAADYLQMSVGRLEHEALKEFERHKKEFGPQSPPVRFAIFGGVATDPTNLSIYIDRATMERFFDSCVEQIIEMVEKQVNDQTRIIIATGGFAQSPYLRDKLEKRFSTIELRHPDGQDCYHPVSNGALVRFDSIDTSHLRSKYNVGAIRDEIYDPAMHDDGIEREDKFDGKGKRIVRKGEQNVDVVFRDPVQPRKDVVLDRIHWLITKDSMADDTGYYTSLPLWQKFMVPVKDPELTATFVFTKNDDIVEQEALYHLKDGKKIKRPGLEILATIKADFTEEDTTRYRIYTERKKGKYHGEQYYEVYGTVILRHNEHEIEAGFHLAPPDLLPFDEKLYLKPGASLTIDHTIWASPDWPKAHTHGIWYGDYDPDVGDEVKAIPVHRGPPAKRARTSSFTPQQAQRAAFTPDDNRAAHTAIPSDELSTPQKRLKRTAQQALQVETDEVMANADL